MRQMAKEVLITGKFLPSQTRARLESAFVVRELPLEKQAAFLAQYGKNIGALITGGHQQADAGMMDALPQLAVISCYGVGYDGIDVAAASERGIWVCNTPGVLNDDVADMGIALMLAVVRRIPAAERYVRIAFGNSFGDDAGVFSFGNVLGLGRHCAFGDAGVFADSGKTRLRPDMVWHFVLHQYASVISFAAFWSRGVLSEIGNAAAHRLV